MGSNVKYGSSYVRLRVFRIRHVVRMKLPYMVYVLSSLFLYYQVSYHTGHMA